MANSFVSLPAPSANASGAAVDVSAMGKTKSVIVGGAFDATVNVEYATDSTGAVFAPLATFRGPGHATNDVAAKWMRATVSSYKSGAITATVGGSGAGSSFVEITAPAGDGPGVAVAIDTLPGFKTVVVSGGFTGAVNIEVSEDGVIYAQAMTFYHRGGASAVFYGAFARVSRTGVVGGATPTVWMGAASAEAGGGLFALTPSVTPAALPGGVTHNYDPGFGASNVFRQATNGAADSRVDGLLAQPDGTVAIFYNLGPLNLEFTDDGSSTSAVINRFLLPGPTPWLLFPDASVAWIYDGASSRWRLLSDTDFFDSLTVRTFFLMPDTTLGHAYLLKMLSGVAASPGQIGFFDAAPVVQPVGVAVTAAAIHAALVSLGLIAP